MLSGLRSSKWRNVENSSRIADREKEKLKLPHIPIIGQMLTLKSVCVGITLPIFLIYQAFHIIFMMGEQKEFIQVLK